MSDSGRHFVPVSQAVIWLVGWSVGQYVSNISFTFTIRHCSNWHAEYSAEIFP
jgi:hypothetical protein